MSELHDRLSHLANYSSQLIFVSSDTLSDQHRTLNDFLAEQDTNTEISYFGADKVKTSVDYRSAICRQLMGQTVGSFVRPLSNLLADYDSGDASVLVCITKAELLPQEFLQELWEWVNEIQLREQSTHVNVILFGESQWAQSAQEWLPKQNSYSPVLLSSKNVDATGFDVRALEALMAEDKSWLALENKPLVTNKWFISGVLTLFLFVFVGLVSWQYPAKVKDALAGKFTQPKEIPAFNINEGDITRELVVKEPMLLTASLEHEQAVISEQTVPIIALESVNKGPSPTQAPEKHDVDFQVPDIISVEQLAANFDNDALVDEVGTPDAVEYTFDESTLLMLPPDAVVLQLSGIQNPLVLQNFLNDNSLHESTWVYETERYGGAWYVVLYKDSFETVDSAQATLLNLPDEIRQAQPFPKRADQIQQEIKRRNMSLLSKNL